MPEQLNRQISAIPGKVIRNHFHYHVLHSGAERKVEMERKCGIAVKVCLILLASVSIHCGTAMADFGFGERELFGPPLTSLTLPIPGILGPNFFSYDGLEMYGIFWSGNSSDSSSHWVAKRNRPGDPWGEPVRVDSLNTAFTNDWVCITEDGLELYQAQGDNASTGYISVSYRASTSEDWSTPERLPGYINSSGVTWRPWVSAEGLELYFTGSSSRGGYGRDDIYVCKRSARELPWQAPENVGPAVNTQYQETTPCLSPDGLALFFGEHFRGGGIRPGGMGGRDIYVSFRKSKQDPWESALNLGPMVNSARDEVFPIITPDQYVVFGDGTFGAASKSKIITYRDFNGDGLIGVPDLVGLIDHWGQDNSTYDIGPWPWGDGIVDEADLRVFMEHWGQEVTDPTLAANWKLDETDGATALESVSGVPSLVVGNPAWHPESGKLGGALQFDGVDDFILSQFPINPPDGPFSILAWVKGGAPGQVVVAQLGGENWLMADENGFLRSELEVLGRGDQSLSSQVQITDGDWHRIGLVWDGSSRSLYVDDALVATSLEDEVLRSSDGSLAIGAGSGPDPGTYWSGMIDEVRIYNRALLP